MCCDINKKYRKKLKSVQADMNNIIKEMKKYSGEFIVEDYINDDKIIKREVIFIFACPGQDEFIEGKPCFGATGENLDILLKELNQYRNDIFYIQGEMPRYGYTIINSSDVVHFKGLENGTLPSTQEIEQKVDKDAKDTTKIEKMENAKNKTIKDILKNAKYIFCFGKEAEKYYSKIKQKLKLKIKPIRCCHLSNVALNIKYPNSNKKLEKIDDAQQRREERIKLLFNEKIKQQIEDKENKNESC